MQRKGQEPIVRRRRWSGPWASTVGGGSAFCLVLRLHSACPGHGASLPVQRQSQKQTTALLNSSTQGKRISEINEALHEEDGSQHNTFCAEGGREERREGEMHALFPPDHALPKEDYGSYGMLKVLKRHGSNQRLYNRHLA